MENCDRGGPRRIYRPDGFVRIIWLVVQYALLPRTYCNHTLALQVRFNPCGDSTAVAALARISRTSHSLA
jgi:hypothetical protein